MRLRVMLVERSALVRTGLRRILEDEPDIDVIAEVSHPHDAVAALSEGGIDIVVVSTTTREAVRVSTLASLRLAADVRIVCVSHWADTRDVDAALGEGASACVEMLEATDAELKTAVCLVGRGGLYVSPGLSRGPALGESGWEADYERLTSREKEVLVLIAQSKSTREIAHELSLSANTIAVHRTHIMRKVGVRKATALALFAAERGLLVKK
jgi:DNA-binding NarL/FixJ family response regulator